ncbi:hypothetical protein [Mucilaginibacter myungsuensis]|uniref:Uncharacterized protein n=1 Tax=Mucilaginibacter myungsuensis TaxID=649104 RepID=A0A929PYP3_9SPHI|nr:hypothetical protein [Mucilaginibacter myungsuensis]MBE9663665.1 hypothetical protein [Mucilaginibacter myungsuensis]MDN3599011.1 hypothetical protein [Mucilaginibacter myungsuensis]
MATDAYGLADIKKEIQHLAAPQLADLVLRLARYKKENKELLAYLLFVAGDEEAFIAQSKYEVSMMFYIMPSQAFAALKVLRKILRLITKLSRFSGSKTVEISLLIGFCNNYLEYVNPKVSYKPMRTVFIRQIEKIGKLIAKLHEDVQGDHQQEFDELVVKAEEKLSWFTV